MRRHELLLSVVDALLDRSKNVSKVEGLLSKGAMSQHQRVPPDKPKELLRHCLVKWSFRLLPKNVRTIIEAKTCFLPSACHDSARTMWDPYPAYGLDREGIGLRPIELTTELDEIEIQTSPARGRAFPMGEAVLGRNMYLWEKRHATGGGDRPGDRGDQLNMVAYVDRAQCTAPSENGGSYPAVCA